MILTTATLAVLTTAGTTLYTYTSANARSSAASARSLTLAGAAEAGIRRALAVITNPANNAYDPYIFCPDGPVATLPCKTTFTIGNATVTYWGTLTTLVDSAYWQITSEGSIGSATHATTQRRTLNARIPVYPQYTQPLTNDAWNYIYSTKPASAVGVCDMTLQQSVSVGSPLYVNGNLCLQNSATVTRGPLVVKGRLTLSSQWNRVGSASARISKAGIGNGCRWVWGGTTNTPCAGDINNVWVQSGQLTTETNSVQAPVPEWSRWYLNASPGPYYPCIHSSGVPPTFDSPVAHGAATDANKLSFRNNNVGTVNLTPSASYTCKTPSGELSWNNTTKLLTILGTIYIDGSAYISNGAVNEYNGQGVLYLTGTFQILNSKLCGGLNSGRTDCDFSTWNPNTELMAVIADGSGGSLSSDVGIHMKSATFQGALQATHTVDIETTAIAHGPIIGLTVNLGQSTSTSFPTLQLVPTGMPSNPAVYAAVGTLTWG